MDQKYYHIHKKGINDNMWKIGNIIEIKENDFINRCLNFTNVINAYNNTNVPLQNVIDYSMQINDVQTQISLLPIARSAILEYAMLIRELVYEEVRKEKYSHLPSRHNCIWLCRKEQIEYWKEQILCECEIFEIQVFGPVHKTRNLYISLPSDDYYTIKKKAKEYWSENTNSLYEDDEYLYSGKFKILGGI